MKICYKNLLYGAVLGVMLEMILILADAVDEFIIDEDYFLSFILMFVLPVIVFVIYIIHMMKKTLSFKQILSWHCGLALTGLIFFYLGFEANLHTELYPFEQTRERCSWLCLNGIEYVIFPGVAFGGFIILSALFHIIKWIVLKIKESKSC